MTHKENITAILECYFTGFKEEIIDSACNRVLEQERCEDAISRQAVLDMLEDINGETEGVGFYYEHYVEYIKNLPSVTPEEKIGHWIKIKNSRGTTVALRCSCCGNSPKRGISSDYCPNCGAKMKEVDE